MEFVKFHFKLNGTIYTCRKVPELENAVEILGSSNIIGQNIRYRVHICYDGVERLSILVSLNENATEVKGKLIEDLNTVSKDDLILWMYDEVEMKKIIVIKTSSFEKYIPCDIGKNKKPAKR